MLAEGVLTAAEGLDIVDSVVGMADVGLLLDEGIGMGADVTSGRAVVVATGSVVFVATDALVVVNNGRSRVVSAVVD